MDFQTISVPGLIALDELESRRAAYRTTGEYPFLIGEPRSLEILQETAEDDPRSPAEIIRASYDVDLEQALGELSDEDHDDDFEDEDDGTDSDASYALNVPEPYGESAALSWLTIHRDVSTREEFPEVYLGLAKIEQPWHLPAALRYGAWNACPSAEVHCAIHRLWHEKFGAEILGASFDVIECFVARPPENLESARELARLQYRYCGDIVDQGIGSVEALAANLVNSNYWYFWWD